MFSYGSFWLRQSTVTHENISIRLLPYFFTFDPQTIFYPLKYFFLLLFFFQAFLNVQGQYRFTHFDSNKGLSNGSVHCIFQDSEGYIWIGTQDGLNRFDGYNFRVFRYNENDTASLTDSFILSITEDGFGNLWIGTRNGLNSLNKRTGAIKRYYESGAEKHIFQNSYTSLCADKNNRIWFEHTGHGLFYNPLTKIMEKVILPDSLVVIPVPDKNKNIWLYSPSGIIFRVDSGRIVKRFDFPWNGKKVITGPTCVSIDDKGILWLTDGNEINLFNTITGKQLPEKLSLPQPILNLSHDSKGNTWVSSSDGLYRIQNYSWEHITNNESDRRSIPPGTVLCTYEDRNGNLWVGNSTVGISIYQPAQSKFKILRSSVYHDAVWSAWHDSRGILWVGASTALFRYTMKKPLMTSEEEIEKNIDGKEKITLMPDAKTRVLSLTEDKEGNIWAGTSGYGIFILNPRGKILHHIQKSGNGLPDNTIFNLRTDNQGKIWASTENGLGCYNPEKKHWTLFRSGTEKELCSNYVISTYADRKGNTWICTSGGLDVYGPELKRIRFFSSTDDTSSILKRTIITSCTEDFENNMWIATLSKGIYQLRQNGESVHYDMNNALESNIIYAIQTDRKGEVWASTSTGISVFDPVKKRFYNLSASDGLPYSDYAMAGYHQNKYGELFWCSPEGLVIFNPDEIRHGIKVNKPLISFLEINYKPVAVSEPFLNLYREDKILKIEFVAVNFTHAEKMIYQYRMKGFHEKWITANPGIRSATYTNLPFGQYIFEVRASANRFDFTQAPVTSIMIVRHPPFWMRIWFIVISLLLFVLVVILTVKYLSQRKLKKQLREIGLQQKIHNERERISRDLHDNVGSQLTYIISSLDNIAYSEPDNPEKTAKKSLESLSDFARSTMQQLRETIWTLNKDTIPVSEIKNKIYGYTQRIVSGNEGISLNFSFSNDYYSTLNSLQAINIFRIVQEAVNNCVKHSNATVLEIKISETTEKNLVVEINDNGKGFTGDNENENEHYGIRNMKSRALEMNGTLTLHSQAGRGTSVILSIPL